MKFTLTITDATKEEIETFLRGSTTVSIAGSAIADGPIITGVATTSGPLTTMSMPNHVADDEGPANANAPSVDSTGIPWDERIHSKTKATNADGTWRKKRGVTDMAIAAVETELRQRTAAASGMYMPQQMQQPAQMQMPHQQVPQHPQFTQQVQPQFVQQQQPQFVQQPVQQSTQLDFNGFMQHLTQQMQKRDVAGNPLIEANYLASVCQRLSAMIGKPITNITDVNGDPQAIAQTVAIISADGRWQ
jgi:hypothetical protein